MKKIELLIPFSNRSKENPNLWALRISLLLKKLNDAGVSTRTIPAGTKVKENDVIFYSLQTKEDIPDLKRISEIPGKKILMFNTFVWTECSKEIVPFIPKFKKILIESDGTLDVAPRVPSTVEEIPWMLSTSLKVAGKPCLGHLGSTPFVSGNSFEEALADTDWGYFSVSKNNQKLALTIFSGGAKARQSEVREPVQYDELLQLLVRSKALVFEDLDSGLDFLFLEYLARSGKILVSDTSGVPNIFQNLIRRTHIADTESQRESLGEILNDIELNMSLKKCVSVEQRAEEIKKIVLDVVDL